MQEFELQPQMLTMGGVFYPTGYIFAMFPEQEDAQHVASQLPLASKDGKPTMHLSPEAVLEKVVGTVGSTDIPLPSVGTEGNTVRRYAALASQGHHALMVHVDNAEETESAMAAIRSRPFSSATQYKMLIIEELD